MGNSLVPSLPSESSGVNAMQPEVNLIPLTRHSCNDVIENKQVAFLSDDVIENRLVGMKNLLPSAYMRSDSCGLRDENRVRAEFEPIADLQ